MPRIPSSLIKAIKNHKAVRAVRLALIPFTAKPLHYLAKRTNWKSVMSQSVLAASFYAYATKGLFDWFITQQAAMAKNVIAALNLQHVWQRYALLFRLESAAMMLTLIFATASIRWSYNACASAMLKRFDTTIKRPPFSFFVLVSSSYALWFSFFAWLTVRAIWATNGKPGEYVQHIQKSHPSWIIAACFLVYFVTSAAQKQQRCGMEEIYGGSRKRVLLLDIGAVVLCIAVLSLLGHLGGHPRHV